MTKPWSDHPRYGGYISREFPEFDLRTLPADLPADWVDSSWHNDACPIFEAPCDKGTLRIAIDYEDPDYRETSGGRFSAWHMDEEERQTELFDSDDFAAILAWIAARRS